MCRIKLNAHSLVITAHSQGLKFGLIPIKPLAKNETHLFFQPKLANSRAGLSANHEALSPPRHNAEAHNRARFFQEVTVTREEPGDPEGDRFRKTKGEKNTPVRSSQFRVSSKSQSSRFNYTGATAHTRAV